LKGYVGNVAPAHRRLFALTALGVLTATVVFRGREVEPAAVLTNPPSRNARQCARIVDAYSGRWFGCEDPARSVKRAFQPDGEAPD